MNKPKKTTMTVYKNIPKKTCKLCIKQRYAQSSYCFQHYKEREREKKAEKAKNKKERHEKTKAFAKEQTDKLIRINDKLFQEIGRLLHKKCICGRPYSCLHHFIRKSTCLATRWDLSNAIPVCNECHCRIHNGQDVLTEASYIASHYLLDELTVKKRRIIEDKLTFCLEENKKLNRLKEIYGKSL